jgi:hypothetical protein
MAFRVTASIVGLMTSRDERSILVPAHTDAIRAN